jgi:hypothetical protein
VLGRILTLFDNQDLRMCGDEIAVALGEDPLIVAAMLDHLVRMGRLTRAVAPSACSACRAQYACALVGLDRPVYARSAAETPLAS